MKKPDVMQLQADSSQVLNAIRNESSEAFRNAIPAVEPTTASIRAFGQALLSDYNKAYLYEFMPALWERIGAVIINSKIWTNPLAWTQRGTLEFGESIEEIVTGLLNAHVYNPERASKEWMNIERGDVYAVLHRLNYRIFYKQTIVNNDLRRYFLSWSGVTDLIAKLTDAMYNSMRYDLYLATKYMMAWDILTGRMATVEVPPATTNDNLTDIAVQLRALSNKLPIYSKEYNYMGVPQFSDKSDQYLFITADFSAKLDVKIYSASFHMDKADFEFFGRRVLIDSFAVYDWERLDKVFAENANYRHFTEDELAILKQIPAVLVDRNYFMIFDNMQTFTTDYNGEGLYWQYWLHCWKLFSTSPFQTAIAFVPTVGTITSVTVSPANTTLKRMERVQLTAEVVSDGLVNQGVTWSIDSTISNVTNNGLVVVGQEESAATLTVTATSIADPTKTGTATITVSNPVTV